MVLKPGFKHRPHRIGFTWAVLAAIPETYTTAWTSLFRNLEIQHGQLLVLRGATSSFGQAAMKMAVNAGVRVIATIRNRERFAMLEKLGAERCEFERPELRIQLHFGQDRAS